MAWVVNDRVVRGLKPRPFDTEQGPVGGEGSEQTAVADASVRLPFPAAPEQRCALGLTHYRLRSSPVPGCMTFCFDKGPALQTKEVAEGRGGAEPSAGPETLLVSTWA